MFFLDPALFYFTSEVLKLQIADMIKFALKCAEGHRFESWFQSGAAFDTLLARDLVTCPHCGSQSVEKALMAPAVAPAPVPDGVPVRDTSVPATSEGEISDRQTRLRALRARVEANADYVGPRFATEARAMHLGDIPDRPIYGEARPAEARALLEEGVPVLPLPFLPTRKAN